MPESLTVPLSDEVQKRLADLSERSHRSTSELAAEAISNYVDLQEWQLEQIEAGIADLEAGRTVKHDEIVAWVNSLGTSNELTPPK